MLNVWKRFVKFSFFWSDFSEHFRNFSKWSELLYWILLTLLSYIDNSESSQTLTDRGRGVAKCFKNPPIIFTVLAVPGSKLTCQGAWCMEGDGDMEGVAAFGVRGKNFGLVFKGDKQESALSSFSWRASWISGQVGILSPVSQFSWFSVFQNLYLLSGHVGICMCFRNSNRLTRRMYSIIGLFH